MTREPLYHLPHEDAPISEWCRPISGALITRRTNYFSDPLGSGDHGGSGALAVRLARLAKNRRRDAAYRANKPGVCTND